MKYVMTNPALVSAFYFVLGYILFTAVGVDHELALVGAAIIGIQFGLDGTQ